MKKLHVINPAAGTKRPLNLLLEAIPEGESHYVTTGVGDAERFIYETCQNEPETHFLVYGGDGTLNEAVNGIVNAGAGSKALLTMVPTGTGNDFVRSFPEKGKIYEIDVLRCNDRYAVNIVNFGFDSRVVEKMERYKRFFSGSAAYIAGVADTFLHKIGDHWELEYEDAEGNVHALSEDFTLALAANCRYYGGGFHSAPLADPSDGLIDLIVIRSVSRLTFLRLISDYKKGTHLDPAAQMPKAPFRNYMLYCRCRRILLRGITSLCSDGEIQLCPSAELSIVPRALRIAT